jgi:hypothetical protein
MHTKLLHLQTKGYIGKGIERERETVHLLSATSGGSISAVGATGLESLLSFAFFFFFY